MKNLIFTIAAILIFISCSSTPKRPENPQTSTRDLYQGMSISDPYRWLESSDSERTKAWTQAQAQYARNYLDREPGLSQIRKQLQAWNEYQSPDYISLVYRDGIFFALKRSPPKNQPILVTLTSLDDLSHERVVVDPNQIDPSGITTIDFFTPSLHGELLAVSMSKGGSEVGTLSVYDVKTGSKLKDSIADITKPTGGGDVAWDKDGKGIFYTRYPRAGERPKEDSDFYLQVYFHRLGEAVEKDQYCIGKDFPKIAEVQLRASEDGKYILADVANGDGGEFAHYVHFPSGKWKQIDGFKDQIKWVHFGLHEDLYLMSTKDAPKGKILHLTLKNPELQSAKTIVPEQEGAVWGCRSTEDRLYVSYINGGPQEIKIFDLQGHPISKVDFDEPSDIGGMVRLPKDRLVFRSQSYTQPSAWYKIGSDSRKPEVTSLRVQSPVSFDDVKVQREWAISKDGTKVPYTLLSRKGLQLNGKNPTLLYGYGGYGISMIPSFAKDRHLWFEHGGVYVIANLRGGGEFGKDWHLSGNLMHKQNVFDDFIAVAENLVLTKVTSPDHLAIEGGSNGGLLMGAALTQRPDLFHAVVSHVGIYDMLRVELDSNGAYNVTEFGTVKDPAQFKALYAYSPYHHVQDGKAYPATLLLTGANDGRVASYHSKKMTARLQDGNGANTPILLRVTFDGGHGIGASLTQRVSEEADVYAFLFDQLGMN